MRYPYCAPIAFLLLAAIAACQQSPEPAALAESGAQAPGEKRTSPGQRPAPSDAPAETTPKPREPSLLDVFGLGDPELPNGLVLGGDCPAMGPDADAEIAAQSTARVPVKVGLTLSHSWAPIQGEEYECLNQIIAVDREGYVFTVGCTNPRTPDVKTRRVCRSDLRHARMLHTQVGMVEVIDASGDSVPETVVGATEFSLSEAEFAELKRTGATRHRYVQINARGKLAIDATVTLRLEGTETAPVTMNYNTVDVPVIRASGDAEYYRFGRTEKGRVTALVLDDERFPLLVDYFHTVAGATGPVFRLNFTRITFPGEGGGDGKGASGDGALEMGAGGGKGGLGAAGSASGEMERRLAKERRVDIYGIYFDFNSDRIRKESEPVLKEIAEMLGRNSQWTLSIDGHTDNIGGDAYNLNLSRRRSASVRTALVERYGIAATRLTTAGHGAAAPKDTNDTPEGRAKNRRVELVRQE